MLTKLKFCRFLPVYSFARAFYNKITFNVRKGAVIFVSYLSPEFALFTLVLLLLYHLTSITPPAWSFQPGWVLLAGSILFYCAFPLKYLLFLLFTALSTFFCALALPSLRRRKLALGLCAAANAAVWFAVKVLPWTVEALHDLGLGALPDHISVIVPVGISYFTLQAIGYLADVYKERLQPERAFWKYLLFISYFPAIVQGPISRYDELAPQLLDRRRFSFEAMRRGLLLVLIGVVKKMVIADRLALFVNTCFDAPQALSGAVLYLGAIGYSLQLYMDFSGCVDLCRGVSALFNIELINNFDRPYLALSVRDFWGKWHISLSRWLKDHIYIPLGGSRRGTARKYLNLFVTFLVSGLWHGAGLNFIFWGALHAVYQIAGQATGAFRRRVKKLIGVEEGSVSERIYRTLITFHLVSFAWIFFRADSFMAGVKYVARMFSGAGLLPLFNGGIFDLGVGRAYFAVLAIHICILFLVELRSKSQDSAVDGVMRLHVGIRWVMYLALIFDVILCGVYGSGYDLSGFLYGGF